MKQNTQITMTSLNLSEGDRVLFTPLFSVFPRVCFHDDAMLTAVENY
jgi:hypothetical protein